MFLLPLRQSQLERRKWDRFGNALKESDNDSVTVRAVEDIPFERVRLQKSTQEEKKTAVDVATALAMGDKSAVGTRWAIRPSAMRLSDCADWRPCVQLFGPAFAAQDVACCFGMPPAACRAISTVGSAPCTALDMARCSSITNPVDLLERFNVLRLYRLAPAPAA